MKLIIPGEAPKARTRLDYVFSYPHNGLVAEPFARSMALAVANYPPETIIQVSSCNIARNRNRIIELFLSRCKAKNLLMVDTDIEFRPEILEQLGTHHIEGIVAPLVDGSLNAYDRVSPGEYTPTDFDRTKSETKKVDVVGAGMIMISRVVLERLAIDAYNGGWVWFGYDEVERDDKRIAVLGDDFTFCSRAKAAGFDIFATMTNPPIEHWKFQPLC